MTVTASASHTAAGSRRSGLRVSTCGSVPTSVPSITDLPSLAEVSRSTCEPCVGMRRRVPAHTLRRWPLPPRPSRPPGSGGRLVASFPDSNPAAATLPVGRTWPVVGLLRRYRRRAQCRYRRDCGGWVGAEGETVSHFSGVLVSRGAAYRRGNCAVEGAVTAR